MDSGEVLPGVELFATGTYRGKKWTLADLRQMATNARKLGPQGLGLLHPPTIFGHEEDQPFFERTDWPAAAWLDPQTVKVQRYFDPVSKRMEGKLIGDLTNVPPAIANMVRSKRYRKVSAEIYDNFEDDFGNQYGKAIRRIALLGAEVPQVKRLKDLPGPEPVYKHSDHGKRITRLDLVDMKATSSGTTIYTFAERDMAIERSQLITGVQAAMPGLSQAFLDALSDDQLAELVKAVPAQGATAPAAAAAGATPAKMGDWSGGGADMYADMPREDLVDALSQLGQDPNDLQGLSDDELQALYDELSDQGATPFADDPATMSRDDLIAQLSSAGQDPTTLAGLSDDQLRALFTQILGGTAGSGQVASAPVADNGTVKGMAEGANGITTGQRTDRIDPNGAPVVNPQQMADCAKGKVKMMSEQRRMMKSARKLHTFAEAEYRRVKRQAAERRKQDAEMFCDKLIGEGRLTPALKQTMAMPLLLNLDDSSPVWKFAENGVTKQLTAYELKKVQMAKGPVIVRMGERFPHDKAANKEQANREVNKVEKFCEMFGDKLKAHGTDVKKTIEFAKKRAADNPGFRAADVIGEEAARMVA